MAGLWRNNEETREGKYPVVLRRDGTVPEREWFVMLDGDPAAIAALRAYADAAKSLGWDPQYVADLHALAERWLQKQNQERLEALDRRQATRYADDPRNFRITEPQPPSDPDAPRHRVDCPEVLTFPSSLQEFMAGKRGRSAGRSA